MKLVFIKDNSERKKELFTQLKNNPKNRVRRRKRHFHKIIGIIFVTLRIHIITIINNISFTTTD